MNKLHPSLLAWMVALQYSLCLFIFCLNGRSTVYVVYLWLKWLQYSLPLNLMVAVRLLTWMVAVQFTNEFNGCSTVYWLERLQYSLPLAWMVAVQFTFGLNGCSTVYIWLEWLQCFNHWLDWLQYRLPLA